jgi:hypothetical protein
LDFHQDFVLFGQNFKAHRHEEHDGQGGAVPENSLGEGWDDHETSVTTVDNSVKHISIVIGDQLAVTSIGSSLSFLFAARTKVRVGYRVWLTAGRRSASS